MGLAFEAGVCETTKMGDTSLTAAFWGSERAALCKSELGQVGLALASLGGGGPNAPGVAR